MLMSNEELRVLLSLVELPSILSYEYPSSKQASRRHLAHMRQKQIPQILFRLDNMLSRYQIIHTNLGQGTGLMAKYGFASDTREIGMCILAAFRPDA